MGVSEYRFVDPTLDVVRVCRHSVAGFGRATEFSREAEDVWMTALMPGLELPLSRIFKL